MASVVQRLRREFIGIGWMVVMLVGGVGCHDYGDALTKSILFFEGQRSGKLPHTQRMTWRKDSALKDGFETGVDLTGGYYDAGDNVKFNFPMAFTTTILAWSVLEYGEFMDSDRSHALEAVRWATDYFLKCTNNPDVVFVQVGDPHGDHQCWERPEDMDTPRTPLNVSRQLPGSEVSAEIAAALAASSMAFWSTDSRYAASLLSRAKTVFEFADKHRGRYNDSLKGCVCPFYCSSRYEDELVWAAAWLFKATNSPKYWDYVLKNIQAISSATEFGWDTKDAGVNVLMSKLVLNDSAHIHLFVPSADQFVCSVLPESPMKTATYSPGGLLFKIGPSNMQHVTTLSFLLLTYSRYLSLTNRTISCGHVVIKPTRLIQLANSQVDYILGSNPLKMSFMVGYGQKFPQRIHHRGSSLPSVESHPKRLQCQDGKPYFDSSNPNPNVLIGAIVGGPDENDQYNDTRIDFQHTEPTTYINAPLVGVLAYFKSHPAALLENNLRSCHF